MLMLLFLLFVETNRSVRNTSAVHFRGVASVAVPATTSTVAYAGRNEWAFRLVGTVVLVRNK